MTPQEKENFIEFCTENLGMSATDKAFELKEGYQFFNSDDTRRLFITWWQMDHAQKVKVHHLWKVEYPLEELNRLENENKIVQLEGFWSGREPFTRWFLSCNCCNQLIKSIDTPIGTECPEELKKYLGDKSCVE